MGEGNFTQDFFNRMDWRDMLGDDIGAAVAAPDNKQTHGKNLEAALAAAEDVEDARAAKTAQKEQDADQVDFAAENAPPTTAGNVFEMDGENEDDDGIGSVDDYMIRFCERYGIP